MIEVTSYRTWHRVVATTLVALFPFQGLLGQSTSPRAAGPRAAMRASSATLREVQFFGPLKYVRTTGAKDVYVAPISVPTWLASPYRLHIDNGDATGANRVTAGTIDVNGTVIVTDTDFKQSAASYDRTVTLTPSTRLTVTLASKPASFLFINLFATSADYTAPTLVWAQPATINSATPRLVVQYSDAIGSTEPAAAGVDIDTLSVSIDDIDRTSLFTRRSDEASAQIPTALALAPGGHTYKASVYDFAGNRADIAGEFRVDLLLPSITIAEPANARYLATRNPNIRIRYHDDESGLSLSSLRVTLNGSDATALFTRADAEAVVAWPSGTLLPEGPNQLTAKIQDLGGNEATASIAFSVDVKPPQIAIAQPVTASRIGSKDVAVTITWSDDQAVDFATGAATIDGNAVALTTSSTQATAQLTNLTNGTHTLIARVADRAGNSSTAKSEFTVDTTFPTINVTKPPADAKLKTNTPDVRIDYSDDQGVNTSTFKVSINNIDRTLLFTQSNASATATVTGFNLPEGVNEIAAEIRDVTENLSKTISRFFVDTIAPAGTIVSPADPVITNPPTATIHYTDSGTGIDPTSVHLFVDSADRSSLITATTDVASGVLAVQPPLADGTHEVKFTFGDQAGNLTTVSKPFVIDTHPPQLTVVAPAKDSFINTPLPSLRITYSDSLGTGVNLGSFKLTLQKGSEPESDIASYVTVGELEAAGAVPEASKLTDGTYHLRAQLADVAGNVSNAEASFEVDTVAPTYRVESPAPNDYVASTTPQFTIRYDDDLSGVDVTRTVVLVDNFDRTARFTFADGVATGTLDVSEALAQGPHFLSVSIYDLAGNKAPEAPAGTQRFTVDTIAPTAAVESPLTNSFVGKVPYSFAVTYGDGSGSGVDPASVKATIDGIDHTADFAIGAARATATIATPLADGGHTLVVSVLDWAGNPASATSTFTVDATDPVVKITAPVADTWLKGPTITVTGNVTDASPTSVEVNGLLASLSTGAFTTAVPASEGTFTVHVVARDAAGNAGTADVKVNIDSAAPVITVSEPAAGLVTNKSTAHLAGTAADASAITMTLNGQPLPLVSNAFGTDVQVSIEGGNVFTLGATDAAGNSSSKIVTITRDTIVPVITVASPIQSSVIGTLPVVVRGTFADVSSVTITVDGVAATITTDAWQASIPGLSEGPHTFTVQATDAAGNTASAQQNVTIDLNAPIVVIVTPANGALTKEPTSTITGTATDVSLTSVKASGIDATLEAGANANEKKFTITGVPLVAGDNTLHVVATDAIARSTDQTVLVTRDSIPPVVTVTGPDQITRSHAAHLVATATDNLAIKDVVYKLGTTELARFTTGSSTYDFTAPVTAAVGDTLSITVVATDTAGNSATATKALRLIAEGALSGQVLSDVNGQPVRGARVRLTGSESKETLTDERGRYAFPVNDQNVVLSIDSAIAGVPTTMVERVVAIQSGVGTVPVDARLTPLGVRIFVGSAGSQLATGNVSVTVPSGAVSTGTGMRLTPLSPQGLPNLLPLGWSPVSAFDVSVEGALAAPLPFNATISSVTTPVAHLVFYKLATHAWTMSQAGATASAGTFRVSLPEPGTYALVVSDDNTVPVAANGDVLAGVDMRPIPDAATSTGDVTPPTLPPSGGSAVGRLVVKSLSPIPSGTIVQAQITETFSLSSGETASEETRTEDLVLYRNGVDASATFPIVPARTFTGNQLVEGTVHLDILAGREAVRGKTGGGNQAVSLDGGQINVTVAAGSLPNDVAISATPTILSTFLPSSPASSPFAEVVLDFSGFTLATSAQLSASSATLSASDTVVIARIERVNGVPKVVVVAGANRNGDRVVSADLTGFAGVRTGGRYVFYRVGVPWSIVTGVVGLSFGSSPAVVQIDGLPFVALANEQGQFSAIAPVGNAHITATVPGTSLTGSVNASVVAGTINTVSFGVAPATTGATVTPANGAIHVPVSMQVEITATAPLSPATATVNTISLRKSAGDLVPVSYVFSGSGRVLAVVPSTSLDAGETYTLAVNGLTDIYGAAVVIAPVTFTTQPDTPPNYDTNKIVFTMPDASGLVTVSAPAGSLPPGTRVIVVNAGNGVVVSYTVGNDGSFSGQFPGTISDRLLITITDPKGNVINFERSKYVATDGSGQTAIGVGGGTVEGPGGVGLIVPDGALDQGAVFKVEPFGAETFAERPNLPDAHFGSGLRITSEQKPKLKKEGKLVFPKPADAPGGAFYYVYRRITGPNARVAFETVDHAFLNTAGQVVTASYPFIGWNDSADSWDFASSSLGLGLGNVTNMYLMWTIDASHEGRALSGVIRGLVQRAVVDPQTAAISYEPIAGAAITATGPGGRSLLFADAGNTTLARSGPDGAFALWDPTYFGGTFSVTSVVGAEEITATAFEGDPDHATDRKLAINYRNVAVANITYPAKQSSSTSSNLELHVMRDLGSGRRSDIGGFVISGQPLVIGFKSTSAVPTANEFTVTVQGREVGIRRDTGGTPAMDYVLEGEYGALQPDTYTVTVSMRPANAPPVTVTHSFLVIAPGGSNSRTLQGQIPIVVTARTIPKYGAVDVSTLTYPQLAFSEPVRNVSSNSIMLVDDSTGAALTTILSGVSYDSNGAPVPIADLATDPSRPVTSVTLRPVTGLEFGKTYRILINDNTIEDLDVPSLKMPGYSSPFTTFTPAKVGQSNDSTHGPGLVVFRDRAYVASRADNYPNGGFVAYNVGDPTRIKEVNNIRFEGQPMGIAGEEKSFFGGAILVVGSGMAFNRNAPSDLWVYDASSDALNRLAVVSLTQSANEGSVLSVDVKGRYAYTTTFVQPAVTSAGPLGTRIQIVDLKKAKQLYDDQIAVDRSQLFLQLISPDVGFGQDAVQTVQPTLPNVSRVQLFGIKADDFVVNGQSRRIVLTTGSVPLLVYDQGAGTFLFKGPSFEIPSGDFKQIPAPGSITTGTDLAVGYVSGRHVVLISGQGTARWSESSFAIVPCAVVAVVDVTDPANPRPLGFVRMEKGSGRIALKDRMAIVGSSPNPIVLNLDDLTHPFIAGSIPDMTSKVAIGDADYLYSVSTNSSDGGLRVAKLAPLRCSSLFQDVTPSDQTINRLDWHVEAHVSDSDGLVLNNVTLGNRLMARSISLPFFMIAKDGGKPERCELKSGNQLACPLLPTSRARLVGLTYPDNAADADGFVIEASYLVDKLFGDPEQDVSAKECCLLVTQRYEFGREGAESCEASDELSCARWKPIVTYQYLAAAGAPQLTTFRSTQRFDFKPPTLSGQPATSNIAALFRDCEANLGIFPVCVMALDAPTTTLGDNPLLFERTAHVIDHGLPGPDAQGGETTPAAESADNLHLSPWRASDKDSVDGPTVFGHPGCPECVHIHWRWGKILSSGLVQYFNVVSPRFDNNGGLPIIPVGSDQDVDVALVRDTNESSESDPFEVVNGERIYTPATTGGGTVKAPPTVAEAQPLLFFYTATGRQSSDKFFIHGGFFSSLRVRIGNPAHLLFNSVDIQFTNFDSTPYVWQIEARRVGGDPWVNPGPVTGQLPPGSIASPRTVVGTFPGNGQSLPSGDYVLLITVNDPANPNGYRTSRQATITIHPNP